MLKKVCNGVRRLFSSVKALMLLKMKTEYHKRAWKSFEKILLYRTITGTIGYLMFQSLLLFNGAAYYQLARKMLDEENPPVSFNRDLAETIYPFVMYTEIAHLVLMTILLLISFKK